MESILVTIRAMLGIQKDFDGFDPAVMAGINSAMFSLSQIGIGPDGGFNITGVEETWDELYDEVPNLEAVKTYIFLKTRLDFDPPGTGYLVQSMTERITQLESRLMVEVDPDYVAEE
ncbi:MAG: hypothetical protein KAR39_12325 [Thermoplasmata archaeon]|nr:hypothetical protein [Thermoplasmata archaeon]